MRKFEYKSESVFDFRLPKKAELNETILNAYGALGWELVAINGSQLIFKRELDESR